MSGAMDATVDTQRRPQGRSRMVAAAVGALVLASAAAGYLVTTLGPQGGVVAAGRWSVALTTTLDTGATITGTGVIVSSSGEVVTSYNVVNGAVSIAAAVGDGGPRYAATTFALSPTEGVAVLQLLDAKGLPSAGIGDSSRVTMGDHVTAVGGATRATKMDSQGAIVGLGQTAVTSDPNGASSESLRGLIEYNAPLPADGAGGPLVDTSGNLIGLNVSDAQQRATTASGVSYAIPVNLVMSIVHDVNTHTPDPSILQGHGAYLGIEVLDSVSPPGALIISVQPGTPAQVAGMVAQDIIVAVNNVGVDSVVALRDQLQRHQGGDYVSVRWLDAAGHTHNFTVQVAAATFA
jgi:S1-C subfamily serine protease